MSKHHKTLAIFGLLAVVLVLAGTVYQFSQPPKQDDAAPTPGETAGSARPGAIDGDVPVREPAAAPVPVPITEPEPPAGGISAGDIPLTDLPDKPEPPAPPEAAQTDEPDGIPTEPAPAGPSAPPDPTPDPAPQPSEPTPPADTAPQAGDTNNNGEIYIPGFGWVKNEGGGTQVEDSKLDPEHDDFDKIIGY